MRFIHQMQSNDYILIQKTKFDIFNYQILKNVHACISDLQKYNEIKRKMFQALKILHNRLLCNNTAYHKCTSGKLFQNILVN